MYSSNNDEGTHHNEKNAIQAQIDHKTTESLESTRRMLNMVAESQDIGTNTMIMLDQQGEQLNRIESGLDNIHAGMNEAEKNLDNLQKCCGLCILPWNRFRRTYRPSADSSTGMSSETSSPTITEPKLRMAATDGMPQTGFVNRITNDDRETEMDENLQLVSSFVGNLKNMALDMGDTVQNQTKQAERIAQKTERGIERVDDANTRAKHLIRKT